MKSNRLKLSIRQQEMLKYFEANKNLSIDQIAWLRNYSQQLLSKLVNSPKAEFFLEGIRQVAPSVLDDYRMVANLMPERIIPGQTQRPRKSR